MGLLDIIRRPKKPEPESAGAPSNAKMLQIHQEISEAFLQVAEERGELIDFNTLWAITTKFVLLDVNNGAEFFKSHLEYEVQKYRREGLRPDYIELGKKLAAKDA